MASFKEMTRDEASKTVRRIVVFSWSEQEIRAKLTEAGFDGKGAEIETNKTGTSFSATVMVNGPDGDIITASRQPN